MSDFEIEDLVRYFHNVKNQKDELVPIIGEDKLAITAALSYLLEDTNFIIAVVVLVVPEDLSFKVADPVLKAHSR